MKGFDTIHTAFTLGSAIDGGFQAFTNEFATGVRFQYWIMTLDGSQVEAGIGYLSAATTLVRDSAPLEFADVSDDHGEQE